MKKLAILIFIICLSLPAFSKRSSVPVVQPIFKGNIEYNYEADRFCEEDGPCGMKIFITARKSGSDQFIWRTEILLRMLKPGLKEEQQVILPKSMTLKKGQLLIADDMDMAYILDAKTGKMIKPLKTMIYSVSNM